MFLSQIQTKGKNSVWRYIAMLIWLLLGMTLAIIPAQILLIFSKGSTYLLDQPLYHLFGLVHYNVPIGLILGLILFPFFAGYCFFVAGARLIHKRPAKTSIHAFKRFRFLRFIVGAVVWLVVLLILEMPYYLDWSRPRYLFEIKEGFGLFALVGLCLIPFKTWLIEVFFKGYLLQAFALLTKNSWIAILISALAYTCLFAYAVDLKGTDYKIYCAYLLLSGFLFSWIVVKDQGLELILGAMLVQQLFYTLVIRGGVAFIYGPVLFETGKGNTYPNVEESLVATVFFFLICCLFYRKKWLNWRLPKFPKTSTEQAAALDLDVDNADPLSNGELPDLSAAE